MRNPYDCPFCGYDCSGLDGTCPECGRPVFRFTERAREVMESANTHAKRLMLRPAPLKHRIRNWFIGGWHGIGGSHIVMAILTGPRGVGLAAISHLARDPHSLVAALESLDIVRRLHFVTPETMLPLRPSGRLVLMQAVETAKELGHTWVGSEHLLLAACRHAEPAVQAQLRRHGLSAEAVRDFILANVANPAAQNASPPLTAATAPPESQPGPSA